MIELRKLKRKGSIMQSYDCSPPSLRKWAIVFGENVSSSVRLAFTSVCKSVVVSFELGL